MPDSASLRIDSPTAPADGLGAARFAALVRAGFAARPQRTLPPELFYDAVGSALFEAITLTPEYGLGRADARLLRTHARAIIGGLPSPLIVAELGSGSARKTRWLLAALAAREPVRYFAIDVSSAALARCRAELAGIADHVHLVESNFHDGMRAVRAARRSGERLLVLFLGSSIGNFDRGEAAAFLSSLRRGLRAGDALLLGADLERRPLRLLAAYDDAAGVTAAFNLNLLARINRELGGRIPLRDFAHQVRYDVQQHRVEMHLCARREVEIEIAAAGVHDRLRAGDTIWTESSYKYDEIELQALAGVAGFARAERWVDGEWPCAEMLWLAA